MSAKLFNQCLAERQAERVARMSSESGTRHGSTTPLFNRSTTEQREYQLENELATKAGQFLHAKAEEIQKESGGALSYQFALNEACRRHPDEAKLYVQRGHVEK